MSMFLWICLLSACFALSVAEESVPRIVSNLTMDDAAEASDFHFIDSKMLHEISHHVTVNLRCAHRCSSWPTSDAMPLHLLNTKFISDNIHFNLPTGGSGIVSEPRKRATAILSKLAITLPEDGDFVETGCYVGTSAIIMLRILESFDRCERKLWLFDSFQGLPLPSKQDHSQGKPGQFAITQAQVEKNLQYAGVLPSDRLIITPGWFRDTLSNSTVKRIAFLRLDGDLFESTIEALSALYDKVIPGGVIYVDDYGSFTGCAAAVEKFRFSRQIYEPLHYVQEGDGKGLPRINFEAAWWVKRQ